ncbi:hypothetical protein BLA29_002449 [Euroglyphus maynei]|uniref:SCAP N-terminal domain-containing protein n=1 Tax=Euroglyphus maynei TaxID=6958 RepID=A0A1Y3ASR0_EURMA|nr:hypothetical protein BLA29_002449 [Euroglyphus maynei]
MNDEQSDNRDFFQNVDSLLPPSSMAADQFDRLNHNDSQLINNPLQIPSRSYSSQSNFIEPSSSSGNIGTNTVDYYQYQHSRTSSFSSSTSSLSNQPSSQVTHSNQNRKQLSHKRTRSVDLRLSNSSTPSLLSSSSQSSLSATTSQSSTHFLSTIEEKVSKLYYKHGLFCSRHPALIISFSLMVVFIISYQIFTFHGVFGSSYDLYISSSKLHDSFILNSDDNSVHPLMKHFNYWPDSYVRNELDDDQNVPPWFQPNLSYAYVQQIYIRSAVIPWPEDMQLVDALRAPFETAFEIVEAISNFQFKNDFAEPITLNDVCFQVFEPTFSDRYSQIASHLPSYSCLTLSPANVWHGDRTKFLQDQNFLNTLLKFQDLPASPVPSGALHDIIFGVSFEDTGIRRTYGRNRARTISYSITLILRKNSPEFIESLRAYLYKRYPLSTTMMDNKNSRNEQQSSSSNRNHYESEPQIAEPVDILENKTKHIYFHTTFTYNYLLPLILIYAIACFYMYYIVRK